ncbi:MAG TPA: 6-phosphogluconolactonase [Aeromicrobium sp.]|nr:6-phosphogluconolactonase [Aeromicrobium sp.]HKY56457.1 6-phosphogluconolactonase [Aeromicrobium sp.]
MTPATIEVHPDAAALAAAIARRIESTLAAVQAARRTPRVLLTGGSIALAAYRELSADAVDWANVEFWFGDERFVGIDLPDRNDGQARDAFLDRVGAKLVHALADNDCSLSAADAARAYATTLPTEPFDLTLLGVGPDGHVASLFPGSPQLHETGELTVAVFDSPKPPPVRVSLTFAALCNSDTVLFIVAGADKAGAVARALAPEGTVDDTPARGVRGRRETLWLLDEAAASKL